MAICAAMWWFGGVGAQGGTPRQNGWMTPFVRLLAKNPSREAICCRERAGDHCVEIPSRSFSAEPANARPDRGQLAPGGERRVWGLVDSPQPGLGRSPCDPQWAGRSDKLVPPEICDSGLLRSRLSAIGRAASADRITRDGSAPLRLARCALKCTPAIRCGVFKLHLPRRLRFNGGRKTRFRREICPAGRFRRQLDGPSGGPS